MNLNYIFKTFTNDLDLTINILSNEINFIDGEKNQEGEGYF